MNNKKNAATHHDHQDSNSTQNQSSSESRVHVRVRNHMRDLLIAGTTAGIGLSAALCSVSCDPIPEPMNWSCSDPVDNFWRAGIDAYGYLRFNNDTWTIEINMELNSPGLLHAEELSISGAPIISGGKLLSSTVNKKDISFTLTPDSGVTTIDVKQPMQCPEKTFTVHYIIEIEYPLVKDKYLRCTSR